MHLSEFTKGCEIRWKAKRTYIQPEQRVYYSDFLCDLRLDSIIGLNSLDYESFWNDWAQLLSVTVSIVVDASTIVDTAHEPGLKCQCIGELSAIPRYGHPGNAPMLVWYFL